MMLEKNLNFEKPLDDIRHRIEELRITASQSNLDLSHEIEAMEKQHNSMARRVYANLTAWQEVNVARHPDRPQTRDYIEMCFSDFMELHGDRSFRDDGAIVCGLGQLGNHRVMLIGEHKGRTVEERHLCYAGCPHPEGYRKALLKMQLAEKFDIPIVTLVDTKGAYPGAGGEERGVGPAIALNLREMSRLRTPIIVALIGEGGSGGALGIGVGDRILMLQHAYYSVISPEGCAAILWRDASKAPQAAAALKCTSRNLKQFDLIDEILVEPIGGAHKNPKEMARILSDAIIRSLDELQGVPLDELIERRYQRFRRMGQFEEATEARLLEVLSPPATPVKEIPIDENAVVESLGTSGARETFEEPAASPAALDSEADNDIEPGEEEKDS
ncbi:MAG: acetyl-CoA carboxylase carboxyltransferase subunit alpha [Planctomycetes bacterium]|nr:acetyl-CoA carboxylase carboxyltransferase subunit alpha [Planctomycetota bacterium]